MIFPLPASSWGLGGSIAWACCTFHIGYLWIFLVIVTLHREAWELVCLYLGLLWFWPLLFLATCLYPQAYS